MAGSLTQEDDQGDKPMSDNHEPDQINVETRRLTESWSRDSANQLVQVAQGVDAKMVGVVAAGSIVIGVAATVVNDGLEVTPALIPMILAIATYFVVLGSTLACLRARDFRRTTNPATLRRYWPYDKERVLDWYSKFVEDAYELNKSILDSKVKALNCGLMGLGLETISIIGWMILRSIGL